MSNKTQNPLAHSATPPIPPSISSSLRPSSVVSPENCPTQVPSSNCAFDYLPERNRQYVKDAYDVISRNEWWSPLRYALTSRGVDSNTGFIFNNDPFYKKIMDAIGSTDIGGRHSGASMGFVMREIEYIAVYGEPVYRAKFQHEKQD